MPKPSFRVLKADSAGRFGGVIVGALIAGLFAWFQCAHSINFPVTDDYYNFIVIAEKTLQEGWGVLSYANVTEQVNSHKPVAVRVCGALQVLLTGAIDFSFMRALGVFLQIAAFGVVCLGLYQGRHWSGWWIALLALLYFQPQLSGNFSLAMQGPVQLLPLAVSVAFFLRSSRDSTCSWVAAWLCAFLGLLAAINAFLAAPLLLFWDVFERRWRWAMGSLVFCALFLVFYFGDYKTVTHTGSQQFVAADVIPGFLLLLGGVFRFGTMPTSWLMMAGAVLLSVSLWVSWRSVRSGGIFVAAMVLFLLGSLAMVAVGRAGWGLDYMLQWRYTALSLMLLLVVVGSMLPWLTSTRIRAISTAVSVALFAALAWWQFAPNVVNEGRTSSACVMSWQLGTPALFSETDSQVGPWQEQLAKAISDGIYRLPLRKEAEQTARDCQRPLDSDEFSLRYEVAVAGYSASIAGNTAPSEFIIFKDSERKETRVAARAAERFAIGRFLRGEPQAALANFALPRITETRDVPVGTFYVP